MSLSIEDRYEMAYAMQDAYPEFDEFAEVALAFLGFKMTPMQREVARFLGLPDPRKFVGAPRGLGKSFITACRAVHTWILNPRARVLIVSASGDKAEEVASLIYKLVNTWDILEYLRPDSSAKDRDSMVKFDIHWSLKGADQSPSLSCIGITSSLQGRRADLLISDDVESTKNGMTQRERDKLERLTKEYTAIVTHGEILYLGTPQTKDSIYNRLASKGYNVRHWTARYPTAEDMLRSSVYIAPEIVKAIEENPELQTGGGLSGKMGQPTDPERYTEEDLIEKELEWGSEGFALQYMMDTTLSDELRQQLRLSDLMIASFDRFNVPTLMSYSTASSNAYELSPNSPVYRSKLFKAVVNEQSPYLNNIPQIWAYIDPSGGGSDEIGWAVGFSAGDYIHLAHVGGLVGGLTDKNSRHMIDVFIEYGVTDIRIESNMGHGLFEMNFQKSIVDYCQVEYKKARELEEADYIKRIKDLDRISTVSISGEYSTGQKERRIIDSMVSTMQRHKLVVHPSAIESDMFYCSKHGFGANDRSWLYQMDKITTDRNSLKHDDRLEAVAGIVRILKTALSTDVVKEIEKKEQEDFKKWLADPMGMGVVKTKSNGTRDKVGNVRSARRRR